LPFFFIHIPFARRLHSYHVFLQQVTGSSSCAFAFALFSTATIQIATGHAPQRWITVLIHIVTSILFGAINAYNINIDMISGTFCSKNNKNPNTFFFEKRT
jgi:glucan phosphoethanolaminetransferase (alkaline phosphatase superfamily)